MKEFTAQLLTDSHENQWRALWERSGQPLGLHWRWVEFAALSVGKPIRVGLFNEAGELLAGFGFVERRHRYLDHWLHPAPSTYSGVLVDQEKINNESFLREIFGVLSEFVHQGPSRTELVFPPKLTDVRGLLWSGWKCRPHYNYISEITGEDALARQAENSVRRQGSKARQLGLHLEEGNQLLGEVLALWEETRSRKQLVEWVSPDCYKALLEETSDGKERGIGARVMVVRNKESGEVEAGAIFGEDKVSVSYLLGASRIRESEAGNGAPTLLHLAGTGRIWMDRGDFLYDWVGANTPDVVQFKKKFRPKLIQGQRMTLCKGIAKILW
jgi:hypothetical protein